MKRIACLLTFLLLTFTASFAQKVNLDDTYESTTSYKLANVLVDVGKTVTYSGAALALSSFAFLMSIKYDSRLPESAGFGALVAAAGLIYGGIGVLAGLPFYAPGKIMLAANGSSERNYRDEELKGFGMLLELDQLADNCLPTPRIAAGYNFSRHFFLGLGATTNYESSIPLYLASRITIGSSEVCPYIDMGAGLNLMDQSLYYYFGGGSRFRLSSAQNALCAGFYTEACSGSSSMGVKLAYSF